MVARFTSPDSPRPGRRSRPRSRRRDQRRLRAPAAAARAAVAVTAVAVTATAAVAATAARPGRRLERRPVRGLWHGDGSVSRFLVGGRRLLVPVFPGVVLAHALSLRGARRVTPERSECTGGIRACTHDEQQRTPAKKYRPNACSYPSVACGDPVTYPPGWPDQLPAEFSHKTPPCRIEPSGVLPLLQSAVAAGE